MYVFTDVFVTFVVSSLVYCASCITAAFEVIAQRTDIFHFRFESADWSKQKKIPSTVPLNLHFHAVRTKVDIFNFQVFYSKKEEICWSEKDIHLRFYNKDFNNHDVYLSSMVWLIVFKFYWYNNYPIYFTQFCLILLKRFFMYIWICNKHTKK